jgi:hypothetical protein
MNTGNNNRLQAYHQGMGAIVGSFLGLFAGALPLLLVNNPTTLVVLLWLGLGAVIGVIFGLRYPNIVDLAFWVVSWFLPG